MEQKEKKFNYGDYVQLMVDKVMANAKIRVMESDVESVVKKIFEYIKYFNSQPEYTYYMLDRHINEIKVIDEFKAFLLCESVRLHPTDIKTKDLLVRPKVQSGKDLSYIDFINAQSNFRRFFKSDINSGTFTLSSVRVPKSLADVEAVMAIRTTNGLKMNYQETPFIPVELDVNVGRTLYRDDYFNCFDERIIAGDYFANMKF